MERQLVTLRWLVAAIGAAQVAFAVRDGARDPSLAVPLGVGHRDRPRRGEPAPVAAPSIAISDERLSLLGTVAFAVDVDLDHRRSIGLATDGPDDPVWVLGYLLPLEGAARWGLTGGLVGAAAFVAGQLGQELYLRATDPALAPSWAVLAFRGGMAVVVGVVVAARSPRSSVAPPPRPRDRAREAELAGRRGPRPPPSASVRPAPRSRCSTRRCWPTPRPGSSREHLRRTADAIARELGCTALGLLVRGTGSGRRDGLRRDGGRRRPRLPARRAALPRLEPGRRGRRGGRADRRRHRPRRADARPRRDRGRDPRACRRPGRDRTRTACCCSTGSRTSWGWSSSRRACAPTRRRP